MPRTVRQSILFALLLSALPFLSSTADDIAEGEKLYKLGKVKDAAAYFSRAVEINPFNATAHYFLGNCMVALKNYAGARDEYQHAMEQTDDKKMETFCRAAIQKLQSYPDSKPVQPSAPSSPVRLDSAAFGSSVDPKVERVKAIIAKSRVDARNVHDRAEERCRPIMEDERAAMTQMNIRLHGRSGSIETTSADERSDAKNEFELRLAAIRKDAQKQADAILEQGRRDAASIGQGLPNLDELLNAK